MPKSPDPKLIMERNRLLEEVERLTEKQRENDAEIRSRGEKLSELTSELDSLKKTYDTTKSELDTAKSTVSTLEIQLEDTKKEKVTLSENLNNLTSSYKTISSTTENYNDAREKIAELNTQIAKLEEKIALARIIDKTDLPKGAVSILPMDRTTGNLMVTDDRFKLLTFTGSPEVGWKMKKDASKKKVVLELVKIELNFITNF